MCSRFSLTKTEREILKEFNGKHFHAHYENYKKHLHIPKYNIAHEAFAHVITNQDPSTIQLFRWGYVPSHSLSPAVEFYNYLTRSEEMYQKPTYSEAAKTRRCLILADGFVEWDKNVKPPIPYRFVLDQQIFAFAAIWDTWISQESNVTLNTFSILTTQPNSFYNSFHPRMPVILKKEEQEAYLFEKDEKIVLSLCKSYDSELIDYYKLTKNINDPNNDTPGAIQRKPEKGGQIDLFNF